MLLFYTALIDNEADQLRFADIYNTYCKQMLLVANKILHNSWDAEDAVQMALMGIAKHMQSIPTDDPLKLRSYVLTAAKNTALNMLTRKQQEEELEEVTDLLTSSTDDLFQQVVASQDCARLILAMRKLPAPYREVLLMIYVHEQSIKETSMVLHRKEGTVRQQLNRGKRLLIEFCQKEGMHFV